MYLIKIRSWYWDYEGHRDYDYKLIFQIKPSTENILDELENPSKINLEINGEDMFYQAIRDNAQNLVSEGKFEIYENL